ncbi:MAG: PAS domain S-box protein [Acidobacteriota bacterium]|nr:PAS domain S-box protein [Acidobacteriota bacterium]
MSDSSPKNEIERRLFESEQRFRDYVDNSLALFCLHDLDGKLLSVNPAAARSVGYSVEEMVGQNLAKFLAPEGIRMMPDYIRQIKEQGELHGLMRVLTKTGEKRIWSYNNLLRRDREGREYVLGSAQDITELKRNEQELTKSRQMFQSFMNNSSAIIFLKDKDGQYLFVNESFEKLFQTSLEDLRGNTDFQFMPSEIADKVRANDRTVLETEQPLQTTEMIPTPDGAEHFWLINKFLIDDAADGKLIGGFAIDITERKQMEAELRTAYDAALESARMKSAFLTNVSHEIRTPMNGVIGMTELLLDTPLDATQRDFAETIRKSADGLLTVINDILDLAKFESGKLRFESVNFDVREVVESTVEMLADRAYRKNIEIASLVAAEVPRTLLGDPGRLRQVLTNLVGNAVKFTERGEVGVFVKVEKDEEKNLTLCFTVTDTGIGIAEKDIKNLFQPFVQVDDSTTRQYGGTGLGLVISKQIVEMMNGKFHVESQPGKGSQFSFTANFVKATNAVEPGDINNSAPFNQNKTGETFSQLLNGKRILIVDPSPIIRRTLRQYSTIWGLVAYEADSGEQTLKLLREAARAGKPFDFVLLDINLPDWEGFSLPRRIKSEKTFASARLILTTAYGQRGDGATAHDIGVAGYLTKPIRGSQFFDCLCAVMLEENKSADRKTNPTPLVTRHSLREAKSQTEPPSIVAINEKFLPLLVVEDNEVNRLLISKQLGQVGIPIDLAVDGQAALERLAEKNYRIILMDCQMPRLDGYQATQEIRRLEREKSARGETVAPIVIIALTAHTLAGEREKCLAVGMNDYLSKPVKIKELSAMLTFWSQTLDSGEVVEPNAAQISPAALENFVQSSQPAINFDPQPLQELARSSDDAGFAVEIFNLYLDETRKRIEELKQAVVASDGEIIERHAHTMRGNSLSVGAMSIAEITGRIQELVKKNKIDEIRLCIQDLEREFTQIQTESPEAILQF